MSDERPDNARADGATAESGPPIRRPQGPVRMIAPEEFGSWVTFEDERLLVLNKPGDVVCHPSKAGPWSSLPRARFVRMKRTRLVVSAALGVCAAERDTGRRV